MGDFAWILATPRGVREHMSSKEIADSMLLLTTLLPNVVDPKALDGILGPTDLTAVFLETWVAYMKSQSLNLKITHAFSTQVTLATKATLPSPSTAFIPHNFTLAQTEEEADTVAPLVVDFATEGPNRKTLQEAQRTMRVAAQMRQLWVYRVEGEIAGYCLVGRFTPRTVAIRNVYVSHTFRRRGIAESMVRALTRFYLGAEPLGFEGAPSPKPAEGVREEMCLNVSKEEVARLYKRCGFLLDGDCDPVTGKVGSYHSTWKAIEVL